VRKTFETCWSLDYPKDLMSNPRFYRTFYRIGFSAQSAQWIIGFGCCINYSIFRLKLAKLFAGAHVGSNKKTINLMSARKQDARPENSSCPFTVLAQLGSARVSVSLTSFTIELSWWFRWCCLGSEFIHIILRFSCHRRERVHRPSIHPARMMD
jgi:hypothetical protein